MIGLYFFFKMFFTLAVACFYLLVGTAYVVFWLCVAAVVAGWYIIVGLIWVVTFIVMVVKAFREDHEESRLINA